MAHPIFADAKINTEASRRRREEREVAKEKKEKKEKDVSPIAPPAPTSTDQDAPPCIICLQPLASSASSALDCGHEFHSKCVLKWLTKVDSPSCPVCKQDTQTMTMPPSQKKKKSK